MFYNTKLTRKNTDVTLTPASVIQTLFALDTQSFPSWKAMRDETNFWVGGYTEFHLYVFIFKSCFITSLKLFALSIIKKQSFFARLQSTNTYNHYQFRSLWVVFDIWGSCPSSKWPETPQHFTEPVTNVQHASQLTCSIQNYCPYITVVPVDVLGLASGWSLCELSSPVDVFTDM